MAHSDPFYYYARRAAEERAVAERTTEEAADRHRELAERYDKLSQAQTSSQNRVKAAGGSFSLENARLCTPLSLQSGPSMRLRRTSAVEFLRDDVDEVLPYQA